MTADLPSSPPPLALQARALPLLLHRLSDPDISSDASTALPYLKASLNILASAQLQPKVQATSPATPLDVLIRVAQATPSLVDTPLVLDAIIAYPLHQVAVAHLIDLVLPAQPELLQTFRGDVLPHLVTRLRLSSSLHEKTSVVRILLAMIRAHEELLGLFLSEADYLVPALRDVYKSLEDISAKSDLLVICHTLVSALMGDESKEAIKRLMSGDAKVGTKCLVNANLQHDYEAIFEGKSSIGGDELGVLKALQEEQASLNPRVAPLVHLFPSLSPILLLQALDHPSLIPPSSSSSQTDDDRAAPLIDAILSGGSALPPELFELKEAVREMAGGSYSPIAKVGPKKVARNNIWDGDLDMSRLRLGKDESALPSVGTAIPDHLRASILRLVESQAEEAEAQAQALREAHGLPDDVDEEDDNSGPVRLLGDGEESGDDEVDGVKVEKRKADPNGGLINIDVQTKLELAYLADAKVFDRDGQTRRGEARRKLKEVTGMDDSQLEGWRIMLDRNPHKDAILARHQFAPAKDYLAPSRAESEAGSSSSRGRGGRSGGGSGSNSGGGRGGGSGGRGGGGGNQGGNGGRGGQGSGGGRGRGQNKGSRGHSNAQRTRGHDKKMQRLGAGS
ncbi:hypothetical protein BCR39DRAFT_553549 [Naematelia encephala]|uniref:CUE domain-containing protein n=1 Tax=Naematelia encephala TaxID=71784 RepID=A0A1Y2AH02_9TREE|nr:hypothetical protein BCR39DRAFT_553549 [Naematelia encephala]